MSTSSAFVERWRNDYKTFLFDLSRATLTALTAYHFYLKVCADSTKYSKKVKKPAEIDFLSDVEYEVFTSICDAVLPSLTVNECSREQLQGLLDAFHPELCKGNALINVDYLLERRNYLTAGAVDFGTHKHATEALQELVSKDELRKVSFIMKIMNTSAGNFLITGYPVPFQVIASSLS